MSKAVLGEVCGDLREHESVLRYIPAERRNRMASLVYALSDLCAMVSPDTGAARECLSLLTLSGFTGMSRSMASDNEMERAAKEIRTAICASTGGTVPPTTEDAVSETPVDDIIVKFLL